MTSCTGMEGHGVDTEMTSVAEIERELAELRAPQGEFEPAMRTSVMTHLAWVPEEWTPAALWAAVVVSGIYHGLNPGMGWPLAVSAGLMERSSRALFAALRPLSLAWELRWSSAFQKYLRQALQ